MVKAIRVLPLVILVGLMMLAQGGVAIHACTPIPPIAVEVKQSAAVFRGRVVSLEPLPDNTASIATFDVEQWWKGSRARTVKVLSCGGKPSGDLEVICVHGPYKFVLGVSYVVFALRYPATNPVLEASSCRSTATVEESADVIKWLDANISKRQ
ncbi:MAG TPA: hypothetical protein VJM31_07800 [Vicinamibacterales bacterium]|nr:hypothetical protein [Vicinamibacterales bacterium]